MTALVAEVVGAGAWAEVPVRPGLAQDGVADVAAGSGDLADDVVGAVLVAGHHDASHAVIGHRAVVLIGLGQHASMRPSTRWAIDAGLPSHVGETMTGISEDGNFSWISGRPSPPGLTRRSTALTRSMSTPWAPSWSVATWGQGVGV
ncbi:hypothetical protein [Actinacidiphila glaucinigra]|uniref:hypothetical protein n=1 Tax=Actinacidiphila glaucinigra TaxID=235986 RepID=UPI003716782A